MIEAPSCGGAGSTHTFSPGTRLALWQRSPRSVSPGSCPGGPLPRHQSRESGGLTGHSVSSHQISRVGHGNVGLHKREMISLSRDTGAKLSIRYSLTANFKRSELNLTAALCQVRKILGFLSPFELYFNVGSSGSRE